MKALCILGSTGSIGQSCLSVVRNHPGQFRLTALSAGRNLDKLAEQIVEFAPSVAVVESGASVEPLRDRLRARGHRQPIRVVCGTAGQVEAVTLAEVDFVVSASHGTTGLVATYEAVRAGKKLGLANKETLVVAGELVMRAAREKGVEVLPIDSEHCAVHQCLRSGRREEAQRLILTGSGGPFLATQAEKFDSITPEEALRHPVWKMGGRITIDSATLMNKGLEIIEAHWLFGFRSSQIDVLIHPESIIHSMIQFQDGSLMAQLSIPDMRIPIQYALTYPERVTLNGDLKGLDLAAIGRLTFREPDTRRFPCLDLARGALQAGGAMPCALNAADEVAIEAFLEHRLSFADIPRVVEGCLGQSSGGRADSVEALLEWDAAARRQARERIGRLAAK